MKALVVDEDRLVRDLVTHLLQEMGAQEEDVVQVADGDEALQWWKQEGFDLVVVSWEIPGRNGLELVRTIRAEESRVPILMVTAQAERDRIIEAIDTGVSDCLTKPIDADVLRGKVRHICEHIDSLKKLKERTGESLRVEYLNPFISSIVYVFDKMLQVEIVRQVPFIGVNAAPENEVSGIIGLTGKARGTAVVSLGRETAIRCVERLLGQRPTSVNAEVVDIVGELANIVSGNAKAQLQQLEMSVSLPSIIIGKNHIINYPSNLSPVCVPFHCEWGPVSLQVGLKDESEELVASGVEGGVAAASA